MKISEDQKRVEVKGIKGEFVETEIHLSVSNCARCMCTIDNCHPSTPCCSHERKDGRDGYFKKVEG